MALREGHAVRRAARRRPQGRLRPDRPGAVPRAVHPARAGQGDWRTHHPFFHENQALLEEVEELEHRARRRDILVDDETLVRLLRRAGAGRRRLGPALRRVVEEGAPRAARPAHLRPGDAGARRRRRGRARTTTRTPGAQGDLALPLTLPVRAGHRGRRRDRPRPAGRAQPGWPPTASTGRCPACASDLVTALIRSLPKALRRNFVPAPDSAAAALRQIGPAIRDEPFADALARELRAATGVTVPRDAWDLGEGPRPPAR